MPDDFSYNMKRYLEFEKREVISILLASIVIAVILGFVNMEPYNLIGYFIIAFVLITIKLTFQKIFAIMSGYKARYILSSWGLPTVIFTVFPIKLFYTGTIDMAPIETLRIGKRRKYLHFTTKGLITVAGLLPILFILFIVKSLAVYHPAFAEMLKILYLFVICSLFPIPGFDGFALLYGSRTIYVLNVLWILLTLVMINLITGIFLSFVAGFILAAMLTIAFYYNLETPWRK